MKQIAYLLIICLSLTYAFLLLGLHRFGSHYFIYQELRPQLIKHNSLRHSLFLDAPGDNAHTYATARGPLIVEIDTAANIDLHPDSKSWIIDMVQATLQIDSHIIFDQDDIADQSAYSDQELRQLTSATADHRPSRSAYLHIIYLTRSGDAPSNIGRVVNSDTIFIFKHVVSGLSDREEIRARLERSTLMHEFGHLLGLPHLDQPNCVMSAIVEVFGDHPYQGANIPLQYCPETLFRIDQLTRDR